MERVGAKMRNSDDETRFRGYVGGGLRRRIYSQLCPWRLWAWRRISWRLRAQSYDTPRIASTADARFSKPDSGPARSTYAAARHQRAVGAEPIWRGHVARLASSVSSVTTALTAANAGASLLRRVRSAIPECRRAPNCSSKRKREKEAARSRNCFSEVVNTSTFDIARFR
jgi:hypothetical protein